MRVKTRGYFCTSLGNFTTEVSAGEVPVNLDWLQYTFKTKQLNKQLPFKLQLVGRNILFNVF